MANLPLVQDKAALRIVASDSWFSGWINRLVLDPFPLPTNGGLTRGNVTAAPRRLRERRRELGTSAKHPRQPAASSRIPI